MLKCFPYTKEDKNLIHQITGQSQARAQARVGPKLIVFLHPSAESGRLSSDSLFRSLALLYVHADHFINDCAYGSIGFINLDMSCELIFMYICCMCY